MSEANPLMARISIFLAGLLFGLGLIISGMISPAKVIGFLDVAGAWDPSLLLVMGAGLAVTTIAFRLVLRRDQPLFEAKFYLPTRTDVDGNLVGGAALFGIGWGIAGLCPGPALTGLLSLNYSVLLFVGAMIGGMYIYHWLVE